MNRLARMILALAVAFVVTARTEAAAEHCRRLAAIAEATTPISNPEAAPCHGANEAAPAKTAHHPDQGPQDTCDCMAVLTGYACVAPAIISAHIEPYDWARPSAVAFASIEPAPDLRPPKA